MADRGEIERDLLAAVRSHLERNHRILIHAATQLRLGQRAEAVLAEMWKQNPDLFPEYCELDRQLARAPSRMATHEGHERPTSRNGECLLCPGIAAAENDDLCAACAEVLRAAGVVRDVGSPRFVRAGTAARREATAEEWSHPDGVLAQVDASPPSRTAA